MLPMLAALTLLGARALPADAADAPLVVFEPPQVLQAPEVGVVEVRQAEFVRADSAEPPGSRAAWSPRPLPDLWVDESVPVPGSERDGKSDAWYRLSLPWRAAPPVPHAIYLWRVQGDVQLFFNGRLVPAASRQGLRPPGAFDDTLLAVLPDALWMQGRNRVHVRVPAVSGDVGMGTMFVGPRQDLEAAWRVRSLMQGDLAAAAVILALLMAGIALVLWLLRPAEVARTYFVLSQFAFAVWCLDGVILAQPALGRLGALLACSATVWWMALLALCAHRLTNMRRRRLNAAFLGLALLASAGAAAAGSDVGMSLMPPMNFEAACALLSLVTAAGLTVSLTLQWRGGNADPRTSALAVAMVGMVLLGLHDLLLDTGLGGEGARFRFRLLALGAPLLASVFLWALARPPRAQA